MKALCKRFLKKVMPLVLVGTIALVLARPASAGYWSFQITPASNGTKSSDGTTQSWVGGSATIGGSTVATTQGTIALACIWNSFGAGDNPPAKATFKINVTAYGLASNSPSNLSSDSASGSADDGLHDPATTSVDSSPQVWTKSVTSSGAHLFQVDCSHMTPDPQSGKPEVVLSFPVSAQMTGGGHSTGLTVSAGVGGTWDSRQFWISSGIEPSFFKAVDGSRQQCAGNANGSIDVHSVVQWIDHESHWYGGNEFVAHAPSFSSAFINWSVQEGTAQGPKHGDLPGSTADSNGDGTISPNNDYSLSVHPAPPGDGPSYEDGINLGGQQDGTGLTKTTVITANTTDADSAQASAKYTIHWHFPDENWLENVSARETLSDDSSDAVSVADHTSTTAPGGAAMEFVNKQYQTDGQLNISGTLESASKFGEVLSGAGALIFAPETAGASAAEWLGFFSAVTSGAATLTDTQPELAKDPVPSSQTDYEAYKQAVMDQQSKGNYDDEDHAPRFSPASAISVALANFSAGDTSANDPIWNGQAGFVTESGEAYFKVTRYHWNGDHYDQHGYAGPTAATTVVRGAPNFEMTWTYSGGAPGPGS